jgi:dinuclear metal center YbgI/SA1388 family protein
VTRIAAAVDLCAATIRLAADAHANLLIVHHGLLWGGVRPVVGPQYDRVSQLVKHDIALYASHLPLDCHPQIGNGVLLARRVGLSVQGEFARHEQQYWGVWGTLAVARDELTARLTRALGAAPRLLPFGPASVRRIGVATGSGGSVIPQAAAAGLDTLITGEGSHHTFFDAEELGLNVYYGGHYATETFGVKALAEQLAGQFGLESVFLDHPTGM